MKLYDMIKENSIFHVFVTKDGPQRTFKQKIKVFLFLVVNRFYAFYLRKLGE